MRRAQGESGRALTIVLGCLGITLAVLIFAGVMGGLYFARHVQVEETQSGQTKKVRIETPLGSLRVNEGVDLDAKEVGAPLYPGAAKVSNSGKSVNVALGVGQHGGGQFTVRVLEFTTPDSAAQVTAFYRKECPNWRVDEKFDGSVEFKLPDQGAARVVTIRSGHSQTHITVARVGAPGIN